MLHTYLDGHTKNDPDDHDVDNEDILRTAMRLKPVVINTYKIVV